VPLGLSDKLAWHLTSAIHLCSEAVKWPVFFS
jgi:hypothetical protein